ncbi:MAG: hypothetical protein IBX52_07050 [Bacterioplanes sp.]|nr:hypothetical protein [Bacterioplanes sp.]
MRRLLALMMTVLLVQGCSSKPLSETGEAVYYALQTETSLRYWVEACSEINTGLRQSALLTQRDWWQRNGAFVESADFGLAYNIVQVTNTRAETGARLAMALTWQVVETAEQEIQSVLTKSSNREQICQGILAQYNDGRRDLRGNDALYNTLVDLQRRKQQQGSDLTLKQAAVSSGTGVQYGRSFYVVERLAARDGCPGAQVQLLKSAWPHEVYDAKCADNRFLLMRCEWGNCMIMQ